MSETRSQIAEILGESNKERMTRLNEAVSSQKSDQERQAIVNTLEKDLKEDMSLADGMAASVLAHLAEWRDMMEEVEQFMSSASSSTTTLSNQASADNIIKIMLAHTKELCEQRITDKENTADEIMRVKTEAELLDSVNAYFKKQTRDAEESALQDTAMKKQHLQIILQNDKDASVSQGTV